MVHSKDPHHGINHINRLFDDLDSLVNSPEVISLTIDWEVLLMGLCWHDAWKTKTPVKKNILAFIMGEFYHGIGGVKMFNAFVKDKNLPREKVAGTQYLIRKHASFFANSFRKLDTKLFPPSLEFMLFRDVDGLDCWHIQRLEDIKRSYLVNGNFDKKYILIGKFWYYVYTNRATDNDYYFQHSKRVFSSRKAALIEAIHDLWDARGLYGVN